MADCIIDKTGTQYRGVDCSDGRSFCAFDTKQRVIECAKAHGYNIISGGTLDDVKPKATPKRLDTTIFDL